MEARRDDGRIRKNNLMRYIDINKVLLVLAWRWKKKANGRWEKKEGNYENSGKKKTIFYCLLVAALSGTEDTIMKITINPT